MVWCPSCRYYQMDCNPDYEEFGQPCESFEEYQPDTYGNEEYEKRIVEGCGKD